MELRLFPGVAAVVLAICGVVAWGGRTEVLRYNDHGDKDGDQDGVDRRRIVWLWTATLAAAVTFSFGLNGPVYRWLYEHVWALGGFRSPSRFGIIAVCALAMLAAFGVAALQDRLAAYARRPSVIALALAVITLECWSAPMPLVGVPGGVPEVYQFLRTLPPAPIVELPLPKLNTLPGDDPQYEFWSITHWRPLVNGYTGYFPPAYAQTIVRMAHFPDTLSVARLRELNVRYLIVHESMYTTSEATALIVEMIRRPMLIPAGRYRDWNGWADVFELR